LTMGVRVDREGTPHFDYQTAGGTHRQGDRYGVAKASGDKPEPVVSTRHYLADADFLVGLQSEDTDLLDRLDAALADPMWTLYLGRKGYVPSLPIRLPDSPPLGPGVRPVALIDALREYPWPEPRHNRESVQPRLRLVLETVSGEDSQIRQDVPLSFAPERRRFGARYVCTKWIP